MGDCPKKTFDTSADVSLSMDVMKRYPCNEQNIHRYVGCKRDINSQSMKGRRLFMSRRIVCTKVIEDNHSNVLFVRAVVRRSYAVKLSTVTVHILLTPCGPSKAYCECVIGRSGCCGHVIVTLNLLYHYSVTGIKLIETPCTSSRLKWKGKHTKFPSHEMVPLSKLSIKSASKSSKGVKKSKRSAMNIKQQYDIKLDSWEKFNEISAQEKIYQIF